MVTRSKFHQNPFRGLRATGGRNLPIPLTLAIGFTGAFTIPYRIKNWLQFLFVVKATALKQQISTFYQQFLNTEACYDNYKFSGLS